MEGSRQVNREIAHYNFQMIEALTEDKYVFGVLHGSVTPQFFQYFNQPSSYVEGAS